MSLCRNFCAHANLYMLCFIKNDSSAFQIKLIYTNLVCPSRYLAELQLGYRTRYKNETAWIWLHFSFVFIQFRSLSIATDFFASGIKTKCFSWNSMIRHILSNRYPFEENIFVLFTIYEYGIERNRVWITSSHKVVAICRWLRINYLVVESPLDAIECNDDRLHRVRHYNWPCILYKCGTRINQWRRIEYAEERLWRVEIINYLHSSDLAIGSCAKSYLLWEVVCYGQNWLKQTQRVPLSDQ